MALSVVETYNQAFSIVAMLFAALISPLHSILIGTTSTRASKIPQDLTVAEKKNELRMLHKRARQLDKKLSIGWGKPTEFTLLALLPIVGDYMSTTLAIDYLRRMHTTFVLPDEIEKKMLRNVVVNFVISIVPLIGWLIRRIYSVNKRNYKILDKYIMSMPSKDDTTVRSKGRS
ncbi:hypothetical protein LPJ66_009586 [Kickxella alabastrina]|uniref:Uncharacterized protein n=1 Tax=Kickxella alabastrina TaxID=61397 RepID=A0ACC1I919_9FUNG|nr:hypothetical protein LPJ66_009586 [Kickxella alabastrina]